MGSLLVQISYQGSYISDEKNYIISHVILILEISRW